MANIAYIDTGAHPAALAYYNTFREEPTGPSQNMRGITAVALNDATLSDLLDRMIQQRPEGVIIVSHGRDGGLSLRLDAHSSQARANHTALGVLSATSSQTLAGRTTIQPISDAEAAQILGVSESTVRSLRDKMRQVQALGIEHVALRACNVGSYEDSLLSVKRFFNCRSASAPTVRDTYATINPGHPTNDQRAWLHWQRTNPIYWIDGTTPNRAAYAMVFNDTNHSFRTAFIADSTAAVTGWLAARFPNAGAANPRSSFPIHGFRDNRGAQFEPIAFPNSDRYRQLIRRQD